MSGFQSVQNFRRVTGQKLRKNSLVLVLMVLPFLLPLLVLIVLPFLHPQTSALGQSGNKIFLPLTIDSGLSEEGKNEGADQESQDNTVQASIHNGYTETVPSEQPWLIYVQTTWDNGTSACTGSLIDFEWVLTAKHCVYRAASDQLSTDINVYARVIQGSIVTPNSDILRSVSGDPVFFSSENSNHIDLALLKLETPFEKSPAIDTIALRARWYNSGWLYGFGGDEGGNEIIRRSAELDIISTDSEWPRGWICRNFNVVEFYDRGSLICMWTRRNVENGNIVETVGGDSGGPLVQFDNSDGTGTPYLVGILHGDIANPLGKSFALSTDIQPYLNWIYNTMASCGSGNNVQAASINDDCGNIGTATPTPNPSDPTPTPNPSGSTPTPSATNTPIQSNCPSDGSEGVYLFSRPDHYGNCHFTTESIADMNETHVGNGNLASSGYIGNWSVEAFEYANYQGRSIGLDSNETNLETESLGGTYRSIRVEQGIDDEDVVSNIRVITNKAHKWENCNTGSDVFSDRGNTFTGFSDNKFEEAWCIKLPNDDKEASQAGYAAFDLNTSAWVYMYEDSRIRGNDSADWLAEAGFIETDHKAYDSADDLPHFVIWECKARPGRITIGGPGHRGGDAGQSNWVVGIRQIVDSHIGDDYSDCTYEDGAAEMAESSNGSDIVEIVSVGSGEGYEFVPCVEGGVVYIDRSYTFTEQDDNDYRDRFCLRTANDDKDDASADLIKLRLHQKAQVRVLVDSRTTSTPAWMDGVFDATGYVMDISDDATSHFDIYSCDSVAGLLTLGGPKYDGGAGNDSMYIVQVRAGGSGDKLCTGNFSGNSTPPDSSDLVEIQSVGSGKDYQFVPCEYQGQIYIDRDYFFTEGKNDADPNENSDYKDRWCLQTANDDKSNASANLIQLDLKKKAQVRILLDQRTTNPPSWLDGVFSDSGGVMDVSNSDMSHFEIYSCNSDPGTLTFGGPHYQGDDGAGAMYIVQIREGGSGGQVCTGNFGNAGNPIPEFITTLFDLEGNYPHPVVDSNTFVFVPLEAQHTTPNGNGWRHEYKIKEELRVPMTSIYEEFEATIKVDMSDGGKTIVAQHHAGDTGTIMKLYVADSDESGFIDSTPANGIFDVYVRIRNESGVEEKKPLGTIQSGDSFTFKVVNNKGTVSVEAFDTPPLITTVEDDADDKSYFKFGNYLQSQYPNGNDCGEPGDSASFEDCYDEIGITEAKVTMSSVSYFRTTGPAPTPTNVPPTPTPVPTPTLPPVSTFTPTPTQTLTPIPAATATPTPTPTLVSVNAPSGWTQVPGSAANVSVGCNNNVWILNSAGDIFRYTGGASATDSWQSVWGNKTDISVSCDGDVWGVNINNVVYKYRASDNRWPPQPVELKSIEAGCNGEVWGVDAQNDPHYHTTSSGWVDLGASNLKMISTDCDGTVWATNAVNNPYFWHGNAFGAKIYRKMKHIDVGCNGEMVGIDEANKVHLYTNGGWLSTGHTMAHVSLGCEGDVWGIDASNNIFRSTVALIRQSLPAASTFAYVESSSNFPTSTEFKAVDGDTNGDWNSGNGSVFATNNVTDPDQPWWYGELDEYRFINTITIHNRTDCCTARLAGTYVFVSDIPFHSEDFTETLNQYGVRAFELTGTQAVHTVNVNALGRYVRIQESASESISFAEVVVESQPISDISKFVSVDASSVWGNLSQTTPYRAVDGNTSGDWHSPSDESVFHSGGNMPWWQGDLGSSQYIAEIEIYNRTDCCSSRTSDLYIFVSDTPFTSSDPEVTKAQTSVTWSQLSGEEAAYTVPIDRNGRYIRIQEPEHQFMNIAEVIVRETSTQGSVPDEVTLISPSGAIQNSSPTFIWQHSDTATSYKFVLYNVDTESIVHQDDYLANDICDATTQQCTVGLGSGTLLDPADYKWLVRPENSYGVGLWSTP